MKTINQFYRSPDLPWLEVRHSANSTSCFEAHSHHTHSIGCLLEGKSYFHYRNRKLESSAGQLCLINADELHACRPTTDKGWRYLMLYLDKTWLSSLFTEGGEQANCPLSFEHAQLENPDLTKRFVQSGFNLSQENGLVQQEQLLTLLREICQHDGQSLDPLQPQDQTTLTSVAEYIRAHHDQSLTLVTLAKLSGLSPSHLQRSFRKRFGVSPSYFQHQCRINEACQRLKQQQPISDVATATGYSDQSHLYRWFRRFVDSTPRQYRQARPLFIQAAEQDRPISTGIKQIG